MALFARGGGFECVCGVRLGVGGTVALALALALAEVGRVRGQVQQTAKRR